MRFGVRSIFVAAAVAVALGCTSPTIPLPPPAAPTETAGAEPGTYVLSGKGAIPGAYVIVLDGTAGVLTTVASDGTWTVTITAQKGDVLQIWQEAGGDESTATTFTIQ